MPACTPLGVKSSSSEASWLGRSEPEPPPQPASASRTTRKIGFSGFDIASARSMFASLTALGEEASCPPLRRPRLPQPRHARRRSRSAPPQAYAAELLGTFVLVLFIVLAVSGRLDVARRARRGHNRGRADVGDHVH